MRWFPAEEKSGEVSFDLGFWWRPSVDVLNLIVVEPTCRCCEDVRDSVLLPECALRSGKQGLSSGPHGMVLQNSQNYNVINVQRPNISEFWIVVAEI